MAVGRCDGEVFGLEEGQALEAALGDAGTILLAAGPFSATSRPIATTSRPGRGTARSMIEALPQGGAGRVDGAIRREPFLSRVRRVPFRDRPRATVAIPWGDVSTAYYSTRIPNTVVFVAVPGGLVPALRPLLPALALTRFGPVQQLLKGLAGRSSRGPTAAERRRGSAQLWGRVANAAGEAREGTRVTPEAYHLTALTAVECARRVAAGEVPPGAHTPATAFGAGFVGRFEGCDLRVSGQTA